MEGGAIRGAYIIRLKIIIKKGHSQYLRGQHDEKTQRQQIGLDEVIIIKGMILACHCRGAAGTWGTAGAAGRGTGARGVTGPFHWPWSTAYGVARGRHYLLLTTYYWLTTYYPRPSAKEEDERNTKREQKKKKKKSASTDKQSAHFATVFM